MTLTLILVGGLIAFASTESLLKRLIVGGIHGLIHVGVAVGSIWLFAYVNLELAGLAPDRFVQVLAFVAEMLLVGGTAGGLIFGLYLFLTSRWLGMHLNEAFCCQGIEDYKNFLRMHVASDGSLTIYPLGVSRVLRRRHWVRAPGAGAKGVATPWYQPGEDASLTVERIDEPIRVRAKPRPRPTHDTGDARHA